MHTTLASLALEITKLGQYVLFEHQKLFTGNGAKTLYKADDTPITQIDHHVNDCLLRFAQSHNLGYVGEEGNGAIEGFSTWLLVDSLDGTGAFTRGMNTATIIATLMEMNGTVGIPVGAVIYEPVSGHMWISEIGCSTKFVSAREGTGKEVLATATQTENKIRTAICVFPGASYQLAKVSNTIANDRRFSDQQMGAFGIGGGLIASGLLDVTTIAATAATEAAAMSLIVCNAGGCAYDLDGNFITHFVFGEVRGKPDFELPRGALFAANPTCAKAVLEVIQLCNSS